MNTQTLPRQELIRKTPLSKGGIYIILVMILEMICPDLYILHSNPKENFENQSQNLLVL